MKTELGLTLEQQFKLKVCVEQSKLLSHEQIRILLVEMMRQNMIKDNVLKNLLTQNKQFDYEFL
ncbi:MAG: NblA/ycf18 family protein [Tychonema bourrellyi B0820]|nr:NblA/ycf18 family protein [Tychonema bourrellyi B0820]PJE45189.1 MAG: phycobilisome degradation protein NblA [Flavobacterium sp.] [Flavobacterium sp. FEMGT703F]